MSDTTLSQDELDAILTGSSMENTSNDALTTAEEINLTKLATDLGGSRAAVLSQLTNKSVTFDQVNILSGTNSKLTEDLSGTVVGSTSSINGAISGPWHLFAPESTVVKITSAMLQSEQTEITPEVVEAFGEVLSNSLSSDVTFLSNTLRQSLNPEGVPAVSYSNPIDFIAQTGMLVRIGLHFMIDGASFPFYVSLPMRTAKSIVKAMNPASSGGAPMSDTGNNGNFTPSNDFGNNNLQGAVGMQAAQFQQFGSAGNVEALDNLALLLDVPMRVTVELGRTRITIKDILNLGEGSIIELEKLAGEPVDVLVNDKLIALGEVVVIDENFSVRITKVITPMERIFDRENLHGKGGV
ncbi:MAG: flagellar motor switch protein FliN [Brevinema sp.]